MTAPLAAKKMPPLAPGEFRFVTKGISIEKAEEIEGQPGRRRFKMVASSTIRDEGNDEIKMSALEDLRRAFQGGLNIFTDHEHKVDNVFGRTDTAEIVATGLIDEKTKQPIYDLHVAGVVNEPDPRMMRLADSIDGGYVDFGASIGAKVTQHQRNKAGGMDIYHLSGKEASLVGIPMNQRSWTYKAAKAAKRLDEADPYEDDDETDDDDEETTSLDTGKSLEVVETDKADMSADTRNNLPDSAFACPEQRKYPINDKAHIRAALSRIADPSNDQCGRDKILAAARREGIGDHGNQKAASMSDEELLTWALDTEEGAALQVRGLCPTCTHKSACDCTDCDCDSPLHTKAMSADDLTIKADTETTADADGQESDAETPETTSAAEDDEEVTDPPVEEKALSFEATDVADLVQHVETLLLTIKGQAEEIEALQAENDRLSSENGEAQKAITKLMALPLRPKAIGIAADFSKALPDFLAPEVRDFLSKGDRT